MPAFRGQGMTGEGVGANTFVSLFPRHRFQLDLLIARFGALAVAQNAKVAAWFHRNDIRTKQGGSKRALRTGRDRRNRTCSRELVAHPAEAVHERREGDEKWKSAKASLIRSAPRRMRRGRILLCFQPMRRGSRCVSSTATVSARPAASSCLSEQMRCSTAT